ncbi:hypothetical protein [[Scytonema hofmanni] UTEX B 1581]|nr:hypothetical protein [[Scytonema hofmanni] UTEX B 1581]
MGMERIIFIRASLTAAFLIPIAQCPKRENMPLLRSAKVSEILK